MLKQLQPFRVALGAGPAFTERAWMGQTRPSLPLPFRLRSAGLVMLQFGLCSPVSASYANALTASGLFAVRPLLNMPHFHAHACPRKSSLVQSSRRRIDVSKAVPRLPRMENTEPAAQARRQRDGARAGCLLPRARRAMMGTCEPTRPSPLARSQLESPAHSVGDCTRTARTISFSRPSGRTRRPR